ncbi:hypothetical protein [Streptomyces sp. NPDC090022]|uniref:hypothetical protein n=1 Tax=Streptomyces sp. NPDC090022 TaxID=3365920 RepID=UPI00380662E7
MRISSHGLAALFLSLFTLLPSPPVRAEGPVAAQRHTAAQISRFLTGFYGDHGPTAQARRHHVSRHLRDKQRRNPGADVVLCASAAPQDITIGEVTVAPSARVGWATVTTHWRGGDTDTHTAYVRLDSRPIELDDVICGPAAEPPGPADTPSPYAS